MIAFAITFIKSIVSTVIGIILAIIFFFLPSLNFDGIEIYTYVAEDLAIELPNEYTVKYASEDMLGFDLTQEVVYEYSEDNFEKY